MFLPVLTEKEAEATWNWGCKVLAWTFYYIGDAASWFLNLIDNRLWIMFWFPIYTQFMRWSDDVQGAGEGPWEVPVETPACGRATCDCSCESPDKPI